jgi:hypothetical protein
VSRRGVYRGLFSALLDDPDFQRLTPSARLVLLILRLCAQAGAAAIFRAYIGTVAEQTGLPVEDVETALGELERSPSPQRPWIYREGGVIWVRNALRFDPHVRLADDKHRKAVEKAVQGLPRLSIVAKFCSYYGIASPFDGSPEILRRPSEDPSKTTPLRVPNTEVPNTEVPSAEYRPVVEGLARPSPNGSHIPTASPSGDDDDDLVEEDLPR